MKYTQKHNMNIAYEHKRTYVHDDLRTIKRTLSQRDIDTLKRNYAQLSFMSSSLFERLDDEQQTTIINMLRMKGGE